MWFASVDDLEALDDVVGSTATLRYFHGITKSVGGVRETIPAAGIPYLKLTGTRLVSLGNESYDVGGACEADAVFERIYVAPAAYVEPEWPDAPAPIPLPMPVLFMSPFEQYYLGEPYSSEITGSVSVSDGAWQITGDGRIRYPRAAWGIGGDWSVFIRTKRLSGSGDMHALFLGEGTGNWPAMPRHSTWRTSSTQMVLAYHPVEGWKFVEPDVTATDMHSYNMDYSESTKTMVGYLDGMNVGQASLPLDHTWPSDSLDGLGSMSGNNAIERLIIFNEQLNPLQRARVFQLIGEGAGWSQYA